jgi:phosphate uptake regulator
MISRDVRTVLRDPMAATDIGLPRETVFDYQSSARQLERIADHGAKIAGLSLDLDEVPEEAAEQLQSLHEVATTIPKTAMDALLTEDADEAVAQANRALEDVECIDAEASEADKVVRELDPQQAQLLGRVVDSLSRTADYGGNVAENALQRAAPSP